MSPLRKSVALLALCALTPLPLWADVIPPHPITDINKLAANSDPADIHQVNNKLFFTATDSKGRALFVKTLKFNQVGKPAVDGKVTVATRFKAGVNPDQFVVTGMQDLDFDHAQIYFHKPGFGLYRGGMPLKKVDLAPDDSEGRWLHSLAPFKNDTRYSQNFSAVRLFFSGDDKKKGNELFNSNGTKKGTKLFANIGQPDFFPYGMVDCNGTLFFGALGQLWKSGGTVANTAKITSDQTTFPGFLTASATSGCFFSGSTREDGVRDVFHSEGTPNSTVALTQTGTAPYGFTQFGGGMIFAATTTQNGYELWYGDNGQAFELNNINPGAASSFPDLLVNAGDEQVYFTANDGNGVKLFRTNGTPSSLTEIKSQQGASMLDVSEIQPVMIIFNGNQTLGDRVYFTTGSDRALWSVDNSDGDAIASPVLTEQLSQVTNARNLAKFVDNGIYRLYFNTDGAGTEFAGKGTEMWVVGNDL